MISAVLQTSFLGDMVLTTPLLERLALSGPVHVLATPATGALLQNHPAVASVIVFDKRGRDAGLRGQKRIAEQLRSLNADVAFLAQGSLRTAAIARAALIPRRVGFSRSAGRLLYTQRIPYRSNWHHAARLWSLASERFSDGDVEPQLRPSLFPGQKERSEVDELLHVAGVADNTTLVALAPGSAWETKRWPGYAQLAELIFEETRKRFSDLKFVVLGGKAESPLAEIISAHVQSETKEAGLVIDATGKLSLLASAEMLSRAKVLVTNDSAPLHLASAMNTPTVAIFGPTAPEFGFGPLATQRVIQQVDLNCRPCDPHGPRQCPLGHWNCMRLQSPESVARAALALLPVLGS